MIVADVGDRLRVITQHDHACFAAELLSLWRRDGLPEHPRRRQLLLAVREHDNGWQEIDSAPACDAAGRPHDFKSIPREVRWEIWRRGTDRWVERQPYAALLIVRHAQRLHRAHLRDPDWTPVFADWRRLEEKLRQAAGVAEAAVAEDSRWLELCDRLSLAVCDRWRRPVATPGRRVALATTEPAIGRRDGDETLLLEPFPLAGATTLRIACRRIPDRRYRGDADLATALALARWRHCAVRVAPAPTPR